MTDKGKILSERQMKSRLNALEVKFTKAFIKEEAIENLIFEREKLKIKQDIFLTRQHNKQLRQKVILTRKDMSA